MTRHDASQNHCNTILTRKATEKNCITVSKTSFAQLQHVKNLKADKDLS